MGGLRVSSRFGVGDKHLGGVDSIGESNPGS
jgi:hypothetical protein